MTAPVNTYDSNTDLALGQVPQVDDPELYVALLDMHNAIETLLKGSDNANAIFLAYLTKQRNNTAVSADYTITEFDGTIEVDASAGDITITARSVIGFDGYRYDIKRVDEVPANKVTIVGTAAELIDGRADGINLSTKSSYTIKANEAKDGYNII